MLLNFCQTDSHFWIKRGYLADKFYSKKPTTWLGMGVSCFGWFHVLVAMTVRNKIKLSMK